MPEHISLINPYLLNETLPIQLAAERDGIRLDLKLIEKRLDELSKRYPQVLIEGPSGLLTPITDSSSWLEIIKMWHPQLIWVSGIGVSDLETSLLALRILQESGLSVKIILNSFSANQNREMIQYQWLTLEEQLKASVLGFVPYFKNELLDQMSLALESMMEEPWPNPEES
jgi:dethiobiotin synthetase